MASALFVLANQILAACSRLSTALLVSRFKARRRSWISQVASFSSLLIYSKFKYLHARTIIALDILYLLTSMLFMMPRL